MKTLHPPWNSGRIRKYPPTYVSHKHARTGIHTQTHTCVHTLTYTQTRAFTQGGQRPNYVGGDDHEDRDRNRDSGGSSNLTDTGSSSGTNPGGLSPHKDLLSDLLVPEPCAAAGRRRGIYT